MLNFKFEYMSWTLYSVEVSRVEVEVGIALSTAVGTIEPISCVRFVHTRDPIQNTLCQSTKNFRNPNIAYVLGTSETERFST